MATYRGDEPSPKGLGMCARSESVGTRRRGRDGGVWRVTVRSDGVKTWTRCPRVTGGGGGGGVSASCLDACNLRAQRSGRSLGPSCILECTTRGGADAAAAAAAAGFPSREERAAARALVELSRAPTYHVERVLARRTRRGRREVLVKWKG